MNDGLEGVVVAQTVLSKVDGEKGELIVRGYAIEDLAQNFNFEGIAALLWNGLSPQPEKAEEVQRALGLARVKAYELLNPLLSSAVRLSYIEGLRLGLAGLSDHDEIPHHYLVTAAMPVFLAALARLKQGHSPIAPDASLSQSADFLRMLNGKRMHVAQEAALDAYLVTVAEHGMNASTFTARVVASTHAGMISAVIGAISALKGPLHGGAPGPVLDMLDEIGSTDHIDEWLREALTSKKRLMGFGHRIYRVRDPRADVLKGVVARLRALGNERLAFAEQVEVRALAALAAHKPDRPLHTNVEFYTALVLDGVGLDRELFTPLFAMGRVAGWAAHVFEQLQKGRLIRPQSEYVGAELISGSN